MGIESDRKIPSVVVIVISGNYLTLTLFKLGFFGFL